MSLSAGQGKLYAVKIKLKAYLLLVFCCCYIQTEHISGSAETKGQVYSLNGYKTKHLVPELELKDGWICLVGRGFIKDHQP